MKKRNAFSELILDVNMAARRPAHWNAVLRKIAAEVDATKASMHTHEFARHTHTAGARLHSFGYAPEAGAVYAKHFARRDPYVRRIRDRHPGLSAGTSDALLTSAELRKTEFYARYARPNEIFYVSWITVEESERFGSGLAVVRPEDAAQFTSKHVDFLRSVAPHLEQAFDLQRFLEHLCRRDNLLQMSVDKANVALLALADDGRVITMSKAAEMLLAGRDPLRMKQRRIQAIDPNYDNRLQRVIKSAASLWTDISAVGSNTVRVPRSDGRTSLLVKVFAYATNPNVADFAGLPFEEERPSVLVLIFDPSAKLAGQAEALSSILGLNPTETRITMLLGRNYRQKEIALKLGLSDGNIRQCLHHIYRKTGAEGQMGLIRVLFTLSDQL